MADKNEVISSDSEDPKQASLEFQFATTTTLHGISRVAESRGVRGKAPWVFVLLVAGGFYASVTFDRISAYMKYDASTNVIVDFVPSLDFPAVTICNYNRFMNSKIQEKDKKYVGNLIQVYGETYSENGFDESDPELNSTGDLDELYSDDSFNYVDFAYKTGYSLNKSMQMCKWKGAKCGVENFTDFYSPRYGQCYTFTSALGNQTLPGIGNGLQLVLDIEENEYTETANGNPEAGIKFAIHPLTELPDMDTMGLSAAPGFHTFVSIRQTRHRALPKPWGVCGTSDDNPKNYSRNSCLSDCQIDAIINECSCQRLGSEDVVGIPTCKITQLPCTKKALELHRARAAKDTWDCFCPVSCDYFTYEPTISMARYPSKSVIESTVDFYTGRDNVTIYNTGYVSKSLVYLDVYYNELSTVTYEQVKDLTFSSLLGELGGQLGLFLGASIITAVEFIDYLVRRIKRLFVKAKVGDNKVHCSMKEINEASQKTEVLDLEAE